MKRPRITLVPIVTVATVASLYAQAPPPAGAARGT
jgi:hypothetical protein